MDYQTPEEKIRDEILATEGAIPLEVVNVMGHEFWIDEMFEDDEYDRIYRELGIECDYDDDNDDVEEDDRL